jgi:hypothetical protein
MRTEAVLQHPSWAGMDLGWEPFPSEPELLAHDCERVPIPEIERFFRAAIAFRRYA